MSGENKVSLETLREALLALPEPVQEYVAGYAAGALAMRERTEETSDPRSVDRAS